MRAIGLGLRLAATGGRSARWRAGLTALGVGLGVVVLLVAASVPTMIRDTDARQAARGYAPGGDGPAVRVQDAGTTFRDQDIRGERLQAETAAPPSRPACAGCRRPVS